MAPDSTFAEVETGDFGAGSDEIILTYPHPNIRFLNDRDSGGVYCQTVGYMFCDHLGLVGRVVEGMGWVVRGVYRPLGEAVEWGDPTEEPESLGLHRRMPR